MDSIAHPDSGASRTTGVGVLDRCVSLLDLLATGPKSLRAIADASGLPRPTAHRLLVALEAHRLVTRDPVAGATVSFLGKTATTNSKGAAQMTVPKGTATGKHTATAAKAGYTSATFTETVS